MDKLLYFSLMPSSRATKKWAAVMTLPDGHTRTVHFGAAGMEDFTTHKDYARKDRYIARHGRGREDWEDPTTPGALSRWILWAEPELDDAVRKFRTRFVRRARARARKHVPG